MSSPRGDRARRGRAHAHERLDELGLAVALDAGDAEDLAAWIVKETSSSSVRPRGREVRAPRVELDDGR
jgi:hypothetical protein